MISKMALWPSHRAIRWLDVMSVLIMIGFVAIGLFAGQQLWNLAQAHRGLLNAAIALDTMAHSLGSLSNLPLVGNGIGRQADSIARTAAQIRAGAGNVRDSVRALAVLGGLVIALLGVGPVIALYLPLRLARRRELAELRRMLSGPVEPMVVEHLAHAASERMSYRELSRISQHSRREAERDHQIHLAAAELRRLGVPPPQAWSPPQPARDPA
jgi:hypothetical protein